jgi:hypothetical protein
LHRADLAPRRAGALGEVGEFLLGGFAHGDFEAGGAIRDAGAGSAAAEAAAPAGLEGARMGRAGDSLSARLAGPIIFRLSNSL